MIEKLDIKVKILCKECLDKLVEGIVTVSKSAPYIIYQAPKCNCKNKDEIGENE